MILVDLVGFTAFVEVSEPERTFATLAEYHSAVTPVVERHSGTVMDLVGDGVCVTFNGVRPIPEPEIATVGVVRVAERSEHRVIGSTVHVAARLCGVARSGSVFATERLANAADTVATGVRVEGIELAGLRRPPAVFELMPRAS